MKFGLPHYKAETELSTIKRGSTTQFTTEFAIDVSLSPDGQSIVFERSATNDLSAGDLWIMRRDGTDLHRLVQNGLRPSWSQRAPQSPKKVYVPLVRR